VKFLVDAQLPARLAVLLTAAGHDAIHSSSLPSGNRSTDGEIIAIADAEDRVVVTKDRDFRDPHLLRQTPKRLLLLLTGNTSNPELLAIFESNLGGIVAALEEAAFVELTPIRLIVHDATPEE